VLLFFVVGLVTGKMLDIPMKELPSLVEQQNKRAVVQELAERQYEYPPSPKVICEDTSLQVCGENNPLETSICCSDATLCCQNRENNFMSCSDPQGSCCQDGHSCASGQQCCGYSCIPAGADCCFGQSFCESPYFCPAQGQKFCVSSVGDKIFFSSLVVLSTLAMLW